MAVLRDWNAFRDSPRETVTYFVQSMNGGPVKIGRATGRNLYNRIYQLQIGNPEELVLRRVIFGDFEMSFHKLWADARIRGEWFELTEEIERFIGDDPQKLNLHRAEKEVRRYDMVGKT